MQRRRELPRLGSNPEALSSAISRILSERASFELRDDEVESLRKQLRNGGLGSPDSSTSSLPTHQETEEMDAWKEQHPCLLSSLSEFFQQAKGKRITVFMDYDGTLTPIVKDPDRAFMSDQMRDAVRDVARLFPTAIISGRGREKVEAFVKLRELFYAGSHGMDITGPKLADSNGEALSFQAAAKFEPIMDSVYSSLQDRTNLIPGASVEHNKFCVSVHFRNCQPDQLEEVVGAVEAVLAGHKDLKATRGRKVLEIRPEVEWNKGHALAHLLTSLSLGDTSDVMPLYIGDDRTDEDAFAVLNERKNGVGILVSSKVKPTKAVYTVRDPLEVMSFLTCLVRWGSTAENGWHQAKSCSGWRLNTDASAPSQNGGSVSSSSTFSDPSDGSRSPHRRHAGRPPLFPPERTRLGPNSLQEHGSNPVLRASATPLQQAGETGRGLAANGAAAHDGPAQESPFAGSPMWADTLSSRRSSPSGKTAAEDDSASTEALEGSVKSDAILETVIHAVADGMDPSQ